VRVANPHALELRFNFLMTVTEDDVLLHLGRSAGPAKFRNSAFYDPLKHDEELIALGRTLLAPASKDTPRPILITQRRRRLNIFAKEKGAGAHEMQPATVKVFFNKDLPNVAEARRMVLSALPANYVEQVS